MQIPRRRWLRAFFAVVSGASVASWRRSLQGAEPSVELELVTEKGVSPTAAQQWLNALKELPLDGLRIRSARGDERSEIIKKGNDRIVVVGGINARGMLVVPGGSFSLSDIGRIATWLNKVKSGNVGTSGGGSGGQLPLGLTAEQLIELHEGLSVPVAVETKGASSKDVARKILANLSGRVEIPPAVVPAFADDPAVLDELQGVSSGTAMAALLRPLGLALIPDTTASRVRLVVARATPGTEVWPIGWPPEKKPSEIVPALLTFLDVDISDTPLNEALEAVQGRLKIPFLFDHNGMARKRIDPATISVTIPAGKLFYAKILDRLVLQGKLKWELRVDEAGRPLAWIAPRLP